MHTGHRDTPLHKDQVERIHELIEINVDSSNGFRSAAEATSDDDLKSFFLDCAETRAIFADDLKRYLQESGEELHITSGSVHGKLNRWWLNVRSILSPDERYAVLAEAEREEDRIKKTYEDSLSFFGGTPALKLLQSQYTDVRRIHDTVRDLRDEFEAH